MASWIRVDAEHEPDLFWALRGGGGNFGIVTAIEFDVVEVQQLYAGAYFFPIERADEVLHTWNTIRPWFPDELMSWASLLHFPPIPDVPAFARGRSYAVVMAAFLGSPAEGASLLRPLRELGPERDTFADVPPVVLGDLAMDPLDPVPFQSTSALLDELTPAAIDAVLAVAAAITTAYEPHGERRHVGDRREMQRRGPRHELVGEPWPDRVPRVQHLVRALDREEVGACVELLDLDDVELDRGHDAEVAAAAAQRPEQIGLVLGIDADQLAIGGHELERRDGVRLQPVLAREPSHAAAQRVAGDADVGRGAVQPRRPWADRRGATRSHLTPAPTRTLRAPGSGGRPAGG